MIPIGVNIADEKLLIDVTYDELLVLVNNSKLVKGQKYRLTDYETTYYQPVTNLFMSSGVIEVLHLTATDVNKLHKVCQSELYPEDIVYYEITGNIGYLSNGKDEEGFTKGKIYRRIDTNRNNDIGTDWRHIRYNKIINGESSDILLFENYEGVTNNTIKTYYLFNSVVGEGFNGNDVGNFFENNTIGHSFYLNTIKDGFANNIIENEFCFNTIQNGFYSNSIGNKFSYNHIKDNFNNNSIGNDCKYNTIADGFSYNSLKRGFKGNKIEQDFQNNKISIDFRTNIVGVSFANNGTTVINFASSNTVFEQGILNIVSNEAIALSNVYTTVFKLPNGQVRHRYYDSGGGLVVAPLV